MSPDARKRAGARARGPCGRAGQRRRRGAGAGIRVQKWNSTNHPRERELNSLSLLSLMLSPGPELPELFPAYPSY
eukprot:COSAG02_NODE_2056_length_9981_cov_99.588194_4_plen_75_part_00